MFFRTAAIAVFSVCAFAGLRHHHAPPDLSSPKATVRSFVSAFAEQDVEAMKASLKADHFNKDTFQQLGIAQALKFEISDLVAETEGDHARVAVEFSMFVDAKPQTLVDFLNVEKVGEVWKIVPDPKALEAGLNALGKPSNGFDPSFHMLNFVIAMVSGNTETGKIFAQAKQQEQATASLSNGKQIALGAFMYVQDYDETYPTPAKNYKSLLYPYLKNDSIFHALAAPADEKVSYSFNKNLEGVLLATVSRPAESVMIYEGSNGKPLYRYEGKTVIGFADGHCKLMTEAEVAKLVWNDKGWKRAEAPKPKPAPKKKPKTNKTGKTTKRG